MSDHCFPRDVRLLTKRDFSHVFDNAKRIGSKSSLILYRPNQLGYTRLGVILAKKQIKKAHDRNQVRRIARESFRLIKGQFPAVDMIILARRGLGDMSKPALRCYLDKQWQAVCSLSSK